MKQSLSLLLVLMLCLYTDAQTVNWQQSNHWKIYKIHRSGSLRFPVDSLKQFNHVEMGDDSMHYYLQKMTIWPKDQTAVWMGAFITTCEFGQYLRKVDISVYGGFLFDEVSKQYYELPEHFRADWLDFLHRAIEQVPDKPQ